MSEPRCFMRYGNAGNLYRTCNANFGGKAPPEKKAKFVPLISQEKFVKEIGRPYTKMSSSQKEAYHRLASARAMRDRREEERKQATMNAKEYKAYLQSKKESKGQEDKNKDLFKQKEKETKELQRLIKAEGKQLSNKEDIQEFIENEIIPDKIKNIQSQDFKQKYIKEKLDTESEKIGSLEEDKIRKEKLAEGITLARKKASLVDTPVGKVGLGKIIKDFGLDALQLQAGLTGLAKPIDNSEKIFKLLQAVGKLNYSPQLKKIKGAPESYSGYQSLFRNLIGGKITGPPMNERGLSAEDKKKREKIQERIEGLRKQAKKFTEEDTFKEQVSDLSKERKEKKSKLEKQVVSDFDSFKKKELGKLKDLKKELVFVNSNSLVEMRNIARKQGFKEEWIKKNINLAIDEKTGRPNNRNDLLSGRLIRAKVILENLEKLEKENK